MSRENRRGRSVIQVLEISEYEADRIVGLIFDAQLAKRNAASKRSARRILRSSIFINTIIIY